MAFPTTRPSRGLPDNVVAFDTETTGLDRVFDQIVQVAGIRTDLSFGSATATFVGRACRSAHIVPSRARCCEREPRRTTSNTRGGRCTAS